MHIGSVLSGLNAENVNTDPEMLILLMLGWESVRVEGRKWGFFEVWSPGGDFYKGTHESKMIGMHIGSVLSGFEAGNVNSDRQMPK